MPSINFLLGKEEKKSTPVGDTEKPNTRSNTVKPVSPVTTYYANTKIFSRRLPRRRPKGVGQLYRGDDE